MKKLIALVALVTALTGISFAQGAPLPVEGTWGTTFTNNGFTFDLSITLANQQITTRNVCFLPGHDLTAAVTVPARYDDSSVTILAEGQNHVSDNGMNCDVSVQAGRMNYAIEGASLVLTRDGYPDQVVLERR